MLNKASTIFHFKYLLKLRLLKKARNIYLIFMIFLGVLFHEGICLIKGGSDKRETRKISKKINLGWGVNKWK